MTDWLKLVRENRCGVVLAMLFINLMIYPFVSVGGAGGILLAALSTAVVLSAVYAVVSDRRHVRNTLVLAVLAVAATWIAHLVPSDTTWILSEVTDVIIYLYVAVIMLGYVLRRGTVDADKLMAAVCIYLFFGFIWARTYNIVEIITPGSFSNLSSEPDLARDELTYYSFVTLTTLGYGEISPKSPAARCFAIVEAVVGVLYLAILISRLASQFGRGNREET